MEEIVYTKIGEAWLKGRNFIRFMKPKRILDSERVWLLIFRTFLTASELSDVLLEEAKARPKWKREWNFTARLERVQ